MDAGYVCVIDDEPMVLRALSRLLQTAGYKVAALDSARYFLGRQQADEFDCVITDFSMPEINGLELQQAVAASLHPCPIVFVSGHSDIPISVDAMKAGAVDFLTKPVDDELLLAAVARAVERGRADRALRNEQATLSDRYRQLTPRERQVFEGVVSGLLNKQIAQKLGTAEKTIKVQRGCVMRKMAAHNLAELIRMESRLFG